MKDDEIRFFRTCWEWWHNEKAPFLNIRLIINIVSEFIPVKRCWYLLEKWTRLGFYDYGVTLDLGWFYPDDLPLRYKELIEEVRE